jgi:hypothetical protein
VSVSTTDILDGVIIIGSQFGEAMQVTRTATLGNIRESELEARCQLNYAVFSLGLRFDGFGL